MTAIFDNDPRTDKSMIWTNLLFCLSFPFSLSLSLSLYPWLLGFTFLALPPHCPHSCPFLLVCSVNIFICYFCVFTWRSTSASKMQMQLWMKPTDQGTPGGTWGPRGPSGQDAQVVNRRQRWTKSKEPPGEQMGTGDQTAFPKPNGKQEGRPKIWGV
jgi:hypothetical protein